METKLTEYERFLLHRALWIWCSETGQAKMYWPGWQLPKLHGLAFDSACFLCRFKGCKEGRAILCNHIDKGCLGTLYENYKIARSKMRENESWINKRAYQIACYNIANVKWKEPPVATVGAYLNVIMMLESVYGRYPVRFVPADYDDYIRFVNDDFAKNWWRDQKC